jgi:hypothetical protein
MGGIWAQCRSWKTKNALILSGQGGEIFEGEHKRITEQLRDISTYQIF